MRRKERRREKGRGLGEVGTLRDARERRGAVREQGAGNWKEGGPDPVWSSVSQTLWP